MYQIAYCDWFMAEVCKSIKVSLVLPAIIIPLAEKILGSDTMKTLLGYNFGNLDSVFGGVG